MARQTKQKAILDVELKKIKTFFFAEELYEQVKNKGIGIATVYRYLNELKEKKHIHTYECNRKQVYSQEKTSHCHFTCEETGQVTHFVIDSLDFLKDKIPGSITSFQIEIKGICKKCSK